ncbi:MAG: hypothetical protein NE328_24405 [Lentisphaeraceae bacterium]|nr:hypothetical protein [Lentisphaeraceae bacterium]
MTHKLILSDETAIQDVLKMCPEIYQDVVISGETVQKGRRSCQERGDIIVNCIDDGESVLDMGANFAYFGQRILSEKKDCCYLGIEREITFSFIAGKVMEVFKGGAVINGNLDYEMLKMLDDSCASFDAIILTSIIHHFPKDHLVEMCLILDRMCKKVIIEASVPGDTGACGQGVLYEIFDKFKSIEDAMAVLFPTKDFELIGKAKSHVSEIERPLLLGKQRGGKAKYSKTARDPYIGKMSNERKYFIRGDKMIKQNLLNPAQEIVDLKPGFLLWDWAMCGKFVTPNREKLISEAVEKFKQLPKDATDIRPWNIIWSADGLTYIDCASKAEPGHCDLRDDDINMIIAWVNSIFEG